MLRWRPGQHLGNMDAPCSVRFMAGSVFAKDARGKRRLCLIVNEETSWRFCLAEKIAEAYAVDANAEVVMIAGSVGRRSDDEYSDIEIDVYYFLPPTEGSRMEAVKRAGGALVLLDEDPVEWEEQMHFNGFPAATSTFLSSTMEAYLVSVLDAHDVDPLAQTRLSSLLNGIPVKGEDKIRMWCRKAAQYPTGLMTAMLSEYLDFSQMRNAAMFAGRHDLLPLYRIFAEIGEDLTRSLLGLNRVYLPTPDRLKWIAEMTEALRLKPSEFGTRLKNTFLGHPEAGIENLRVLITETLDLVAANVPGFDVAAQREQLEQSRRSWKEPPV